MSDEWLDVPDGIDPQDFLKSQSQLTQDRVGSGWVDVPDGIDPHEFLRTRADRIQERVGMDPLRAAGFSEGFKVGWNPSSQQAISVTPPNGRETLLGNAAIFGTGAINNLANTIPAIGQEIADVAQTVYRAPGEIRKLTPSWQDFRPLPEPPPEPDPTGSLPGQRIEPYLSPQQHMVNVAFGEYGREGRENGNISRGINGATKLLQALPVGLNNAYLSARTDGLQGQEKADMERRLQLELAGNLAPLALPGVGHATKLAFGHVLGRAGDIWGDYTDETPSTPIITPTEGMSPGQKKRTEFLERAGNEITGVVSSVGPTAVYGHKAQRKIAATETKLGNITGYLSAQERYNELASALTASVKDGQIRPGFDPAVDVDGSSVTLSKALREDLPEAVQIEGLQSDYGVDGGSHFNPLAARLKELKQDAGDNLNTLYGQVDPNTNITYGQIFAPLREGGDNLSDAKMTPRIALYNEELQRVANRVLPAGPNGHREQFTKLHLKLTRGEGATTAGMSVRIPDPADRARYVAYRNWIESEPLTIQDVRKLASEHGGFAKYDKDGVAASERESAQAHQALDAELRKQRDRYMGEQLGKDGLEEFRKENRRFAVANQAHDLADKQVRSKAFNKNAERSENQAQAVDVPNWIRERWKSTQDPVEMIARSVDYNDPRGLMNPTTGTAQQIASFFNHSMALPTDMSAALIDPTLQSNVSGSMQHYKQSEEAPAAMVGQALGMGADAMRDTVVSPLQTTIRAWDNVTNGKLGQTAPGRGANRLIEMLAGAPEGLSNSLPGAPSPAAPPTENSNFNSLEAGPDMSLQPFPRDTNLIKQNEQAFMNRVAYMTQGNPQLLKDVATVLASPNQLQKETALAQLATQLPDLFATSKYPSEMNGRLTSPIDKDEFEKEITMQKANRLMDPIAWAKQISALNIDGRILPQQGQGTPTAGAGAQLFNGSVETVLGQRRSYDY